MEELKSGNISDAVIANIFASNENKCYLYDEKRKIWYSLSYPSNIWREESADLLSARSILEDSLLKTIKGILKKKMKEKDEKYYKLIGKITNKLQNTRSQDGIIKALRNKFKHPNTSKLLDQNDYLFVFNNGAFDLKLKKFRSTQLEDYVTMTTGYDFQKIKKEKFKEVNRDVINNIFINKKTKAFTFEKLSETLIKVNRDEEAIFLVGEGRNGKTLIQNFLEASHGPYWGTLRADILLESGRVTNGDKPTPSLTQKKMCRGVGVSEPRKNAEFNDGMFKELTGGSPLDNRGLGKDPEPYTPGYNLYFFCNSIPILPDTDRESIQDRVVIIDFPVYFGRPGKGKYDSNNPLHRKIIPELKEKVFQDPQYRLSFFGILLYYYYKKESNPEPKPESVKWKTNSYFMDNDSIGKFLAKKCIITKKNEDYIQSSVLYEQYVDFCKDEEIRYQNQKTFTNYCKRKQIENKKITSGDSKGCMAFYGIRKKENDEEMDENDGRKIEPFDDTEEILKFLSDLGLVEEEKLNPIDEIKKINDSVPKFTRERYLECLKKLTDLENKQKNKEVNCNDVAEKKVDEKVTEELIEVFEGLDKEELKEEDRKDEIVLENDENDIIDLNDDNEKITLDWA